MRPEVFEIELLNRPTLSFFSGETIHGILHVVVGPTQRYTCKGIMLTIQGKGAVSYSDILAAGNNTTIVTGEETYVKHEENLVEDEEVLLSPGNYDYPFQFKLRRSLPSSFHSPYGSIRYKIQTEMLTGTFKSNHKAKVPFILNSFVDLNVEPSAAKQIRSERLKSMGYLCCKSGPVGFTIRLPKTGYVSGEVFQFTAELVNQSREPVKSVTAEFVQRVIYRAKTSFNPSIKVCGTDIFSATSPPVEPGASDVWTVSNFEIPPLPPTSKLTGHLIEVQYFLKVTMRLSGASTNVTCDIPILIGSIPLQSNFQEINRLLSNNVNFTPAVESPSRKRAVTAMDSSQLTYLQQYYPDLPPPSYAEAILQPESAGTETETGTSGGRPNGTFEGDNSVEKSNKIAPQYVTYR